MIRNGRILKWSLKTNFKINSRMVLDISAIRAEDGGDPAKIKKLQTDRFKVFFFARKKTFLKNHLECRNR